MQNGVLTSFALYDLYRTNTVHEQQLTSDIRSRIDYLIPINDITVVVDLKLTKNLISLASLIQLYRPTTY